jgi:hypothetical protein
MEWAYLLGMAKGKDSDEDCRTSHSTAFQQERDPTPRQNSYTVDSFERNVFLFFKVEA